MLCCWVVGLAFLVGFTLILVLFNVLFVHLFVFGYCFDSLVVVF